MAHKKAASSSDNGRDSNPKYLGVKLFGGQYAKAGNILVRQRGTKYHPGENVYMGKDHTLHAKIEGYVDFRKRREGRTFVNILPLDGKRHIATPKAKKAKSAAPNVTASAAASAPAAKVAAPTPPAPKKAEAPAAKAAPAAAKSVGAKPDKLTKIEGIGPKIAEHLGAGGIITFADLAGAPVSKLKEILEAAGPRFKMHIPDTWPQQAQLAADGKWDELQVLQDKLDGGRPLEASSEEE